MELSQVLTSVLGNAIWYIFLAAALGAFGGGGVVRWFVGKKFGDEIAVGVRQEDNLTINLLFDHGKHDDYFVALEPKMRITASGQLYSANEYGITLEKCELTE